VSAEAPAPTDADRLWDDAHPFEGSYLIASEENNRQSFQLVNVDMAVVYQVGTSDEAARNAAYRVGDAEAFIQALSGQILVRYLSHHQLLELLGENRENLSTDFRSLLQKQLDHFDTGVEVLAISIEAIHPPPGAASAYHDVQAAQIRSSTHVAQSRGNAARSDEQAQQFAATQRNEAAAAAAERTSQAQIAATLFGGDQKAYANDGVAFLMERWFDDLKKTLQEPDVLLIDHRLKGQASPTLDMRSMSPAPFDRSMMRE
jgi:regulator of protease activity HflC (stomatin/prohibitin superfamily)